MSKIGVGVGEDFPVDDADGNKAAAAQAPQNEADDRAEFEAWKRARDEERRDREESHRRHEEWHQRKREFKDRVRAAAHESFGRDDRDGHDHWHEHRQGWHSARFWPLGLGIGLLVLAIPVILIALFFSLISAAFKAPFVIIALVAIAVLFFAFHHRHGHHRFAYHLHDGGRRYYYDSDIETPPRPQQPPKQNTGTPPTVTPPSGK